MPGGGQLGNRNAEKRQWNAAIYRALEKRGTSRLEALDNLAEKLLAKCDEGDMSALRELGDRIDGKAAQAINVSGEDGGPLKGSLTVEFVSPIPR